MHIHTLVLEEEEEGGERGKIMFRVSPPHSHIYVYI